MVKRIAFLVLACGPVLLTGCPDDLGKKVRKPSGSPVADPTNLTATASGGFDVQLAWNDNAVGEAGYRLEMTYSGFGAGPVSEFRILSAETNSCLFPATPNTTYYFRVFAVTDQMESGPSNVASLTVPKVFEPPHSLLAVSESPTQVVLSWSEVRGETAYVVELSQDNGVSWTLAGSAAADSKAVTISGLSPSTEYLLRAKTLYSYGESAPSSSVGVLTLTPGVVTKTITTQVDSTGMSIARTLSGAVRVSSYDAQTSLVLVSGPLGNDPSAVIYTTAVVDAGPTGTEDVGPDGTSLVMDGAVEHGLAHDATNNSLRYWSNPAGPHVATTIDSGGGAAPRILRNPLNGTLQALYRHASSQLKYLVREPGPGWTASELLDVQLDASTPHDAAMDPTGSPHVALIDSQGRLVHAVRPVDFGVWVYTVQPQFPSTLKADRVSLAADAVNTPHLFFHEAQTRTLRHVTRVNAQWVTEAVDDTPGADTGLWSAAVVQPGSGRIHVAYYDSTRGDLRYARKDGNGPWVRRLLDAKGDVGSHPAIVVDSAGKVTIAYRDATSRQIKLAEGSY